VVPFLDKELGKMFLLGAAEEENHNTKDGLKKSMDQNKHLSRHPLQICGNCLDLRKGLGLRPYQFSISEHQVETLDPPPEARS